MHRIGAGDASQPPASTPRHEISISAERISELIGAIYDCVLDPLRWEATLESINREFAFANSVLAVFPVRAGGHVINVSVGFDEEWLGIGTKYREESVALWGGAERAQQFPLDEPIVASETAGYADRNSN